MVMKDVAGVINDQTSKKSKKKFFFSAIFQLSETAGLGRLDTLIVLIPITETTSASNKQKQLLILDFVHTAVEN